MSDHALAVVMASCSITGSLPTDSDSVSDAEPSVGDFSVVSLSSFDSEAADVGFSFSFCHHITQITHRYFRIQERLHMRSTQLSARVRPAE